MSSHIALVRRNVEPGWAILSKSAAGGAWAVLSASVADGQTYVREEFLSLARQHPRADLSFSTRTAAQFTDHSFEALGQSPLAEIENALPGTGITLLVPEGMPHEPERFVALWKSHTGTLTGGPASRFMRIALLDQIERWFKHDGVEHKKLRGLELWIRNNQEWQARALLPDAFPPIVDMRPSSELIADRRAKFARINADKAAAAMAKRERESESADKQAQRDWLDRRLGGGDAA